MFSSLSEFEQWLVHLSADADEPSFIEIHFDKLESLLTMIIQDKKFEDPISTKESALLKEIYHKVIPKMQKYLEMSSETQEKYLHFYDLLVQIGLTGISNSLFDRIQILNQIIFDHECLTFQSNSQTNLFEKVVNIFTENSVIEKLHDYLIHEETSISCVYIISQLYLSIKEYYPDFDTSDAFSSVFDAIIRIGKQKIRLLVTNEILRFRDMVVQNFPDEETTSKLADIYSLLANCEIFDRQLFGYQMILRSLETSSRQLTLDWFQIDNNLQILKRKEPHPQIMPILASIASILASEDLLPFEIISDLWSQNSVIHSSDLDAFFKMFVTIAGTILDNYFTDYLKLVQHPEQKSPQWFQFIINLCEAFGKRPDAQIPFTILREFIFRESFNAESEFNEHAKKGLVSVLKYHMNSDQLLDISNDLIQKIPDDAFNILQGIIGNLELTADESVMELFQIAINQLSNLSRKPIYSFILELSKKLHLIFDEQITEQLFSQEIDANFYYFLMQIIKSGLIDPDIIDNFLTENDLDFDYESFTNLLKTIVLKSLPDPTIDDYPFPHEDLIWKYAKIHSKQQNKIFKFLVKMYLKNNPNYIDNQTTIKNFLEKWKSQYDSEDDSLLTLLHLFIKIAEKKVDYEKYDMEPHIYSIAPRVQIEVTNSATKEVVKREVSSRISIAALTKQFCERFGLSYYNNELHASNGDALDINKYLYNYNLKEPIKLTIVPRQFNKEINSKIYDELPSNIVYREPIMNHLIEKLQNGSERAKILLDDLPTYEETINSIDNIEDKDFDYESFLPIDKPLYFMYNFETLISSDNIEQMPQQGFSYIINCIKEADDNITKNIFDFIQKNLSKEDKKKLSQDIFNACWFRIYNNFQMDEDFLLPIFSLLSELYSLNSDIELPDFVPDVIQQILNSGNENLIQGSKSLFCELPISQDLLIKALQTSENKGHIYEIIGSHIEGFNADLFEEILISIDNPSCPHLKQALRCAKVLVSNGLEEEEIERLSDSLIRRYLNLDSDRSDGCFTLACKILGALPESDVLANHLKLILDKSKPIRCWNTSGDIEVKSRHSAGLINLGATCFFNSTLQQFYAIPDVRKAIIEYKGDNSVMVEMRDLFSRMCYSNKQCQNPESLIDKWVGWDKQSLNPLVQQDACEFLQNFLDKLEKSLGVEFVHKLFQGTTMHYTEGINEKYQSEASEPFLTLTVPVKNMSNIDESFKQMMTPEYFIGANKYHAEGIGKIDARRYAKQGVLPPFLIMQLSRFEYNYETWRRTKIDNPFSFPVNLEINDTKYKLCGVIVHIGTADFGHYVSYVRNRSTGEWYNCNDESVTDITENEVLTTSLGANARSAYLLFYDREDVNYNVDMQCDEDILKDIEESNEQIQVTSLIYSTPFFEMMKNLMNAQTLEYFFKYFPFTTFTNKSEDLGDELIKQIKGEDNELILDELATVFKSDVGIADALLYSPIEELREAAVRLFDYLKEFDLTAADSFFNTIKHIPQHSEGVQQFLEAVNHMLESDEVMEHAIKNDWIHEIVSLLSTRIPDYCKSKGITHYKYYSDKDLLVVLDIYSKFAESNDLIKHTMTSTDFITQVLCSRTSLKTLCEYLPEETNDEATDSYIKSAIEYGASVVRITEFAYRMKQEEFISYLMNLDEIPVANWLGGMCALTKQNRPHKFVETMMRLTDEWAPYILSKKEDERVVTLYIIATICPSPSFTTVLPLWPASLKVEASEVKFTVMSQLNKKQTEYAEHFVEFFATKMNEFTDKIQNMYYINQLSVIQFIQALTTCIHIVGDTRETMLLEQLVESLRGQAKIFDKPLEMLLNKLTANQHFVKVCDDFLSTVVKTNNDKEANEFITAILPHVRAEIVSPGAPPISPKCAHCLIKSVTLIPNIHVYKKYEELVTLISMQHPKVISEFLNNSELPPHSLRACLILSDASSVKFPSLSLLSRSMHTLPSLDLNQTVLKAIACNNGRLVEKEINDILANNLLKDSAREKVNELLKSPKLIKMESTTDDSDAKSEMEGARSDVELLKSDRENYQSSHRNIVLKSNGSDVERSDSVRDSPKVTFNTSYKVADDEEEDNNEPPKIVNESIIKSHKSVSEEDNDTNEPEEEDDTKQQNDEEKQKSEFEKSNVEEEEDEDKQSEDKSTESKEEEQKADDEE